MMVWRGYLLLVFVSMCIGHEQSIQEDKASNDGVSDQSAVDGMENNDQGSQHRDKDGPGHNHGHDHHHDHFHEDEVDMVKRGKEKWFKPVVEQHEHDSVESAGPDTDKNQGLHDHGQGHQDHEHHHHEHEHHNHGHGHHNHGHGHHESREPGIGQQVEATWKTWWESLLATVLISIAPYFILHFVPLEKNTKEQEPLLKLLLSFASGGLLGDAFLHLIPHAINPHVHGAEEAHGHDHTHGGHEHHHHHGEAFPHEHHHDMSVGVWVLAGIIAFLVVEMFVRHIKSGHSHGHSHSHSTSSDETPSDAGKKNKKEEKKATGGKEQKARTDKNAKEGGKKDDENEDQKEEKEEAVGDTDSDIKVSGYLNLTADFAHNFTDGLAIGASFLVSRNLGVITTLTVLLHEIPHEIGDFAILVQSGYNKQKAMLLQLSTATGALAGCICGLLADNLSATATSWILPFTAGGFIYIATVSVIPELLEENSFKQSLKEVVALLVGILMMVLMCFLE